MQALVDEWADTAAQVHIPNGPYDHRTEDTYLCWFHKVTQVRFILEPLEPLQHEPEVTNTFATEATTAYHVMVHEDVSLY